MKNLRSLLIDDEPNARMRLRRLLKDEERVEVIGEAKDGLEAVAEIQRLRPDLVFLDVQMPGLDGESRRSDRLREAHSRSLWTTLPVPGLK
jgi:DNA-binding NarL/FixJ family response regulator